MRTIKIFGRNVPIAILAILICGAVASAGALAYFTIREQVTVSERTPVVADPMSFSVDIAQGGKAYQTITITNLSDIEQPIELVPTVTALEGNLTPDQITVSFSVPGNTLTLQPNGQPNNVVEVVVTTAASWDCNPGRYAVTIEIVPVSPIWIESTLYTPENAGDVWPVPLTGTTSVESYSDEIHVNTDDQNLGAFNLTITYNENIIEYQSAEWPDGWSVIDNPMDGTVIIGGYTATNPLKGNDVTLLTIAWKKVGTGTTVLDLTVTELTDYDNSLLAVGTPNGIDGERTLVE